MENDLVKACNLVEGPFREFADNLEHIDDISDAIDRFLSMPITGIEDRVVCLRENLEKILLNAVEQAWVTALAKAFGETVEE